MHTFKDKKDTEWKLDLNFGAILRVKQLSGGRYDLMKPEQKITHPDFSDTGVPLTLQALLMLDYPTLYEVLFMAVEPQAKDLGVTAEQFAERIAADCIVKAKEAFRQEWHDFFQDLQRPDQAIALERIGEWMKQAQRKLSQAADSLPLKDLDNKVTEMMDSSLKTSSGKLEAFLKSTPADSLGGNST